MKNVFTLHVRNQTEMLHFLDSVIQYQHSTLVASIQNTAPSNLVEFPNNANDISCIQLSLLRSAHSLGAKNTDSIVYTPNVWSLPKCTFLIKRNMNIWSSKVKFKFSSVLVWHRSLSESKFEKGLKWTSLWNTWSLVYLGRVSLGWSRNYESS
jgi:hypothetical protein